MLRAVAEALASLGHVVRVHRSAGPPQALVPLGNAAVPRPTPPRWKRKFEAKAWFLKALWRNRAMQRRDLAALREMEPDVVLCRQEAYCYSMQTWCARLGFPLVVLADAPLAHEARLRSDPDYWHPRGLLEAVERASLQSAESVITSSRCARTLFQGVAPGVPIHFVPNGVDPRRFAPLKPEERSALKARWGLCAQKVVGFLETFHPFQRLELLRELVRWSATRNDIQWLLVGDGPGRTVLQEETRDAKRVVLTGNQPPEVVGPLLQLMDVGVAPGQESRGEFCHFPLSVFEYAAAGCAVLASAQGDIPYLMDEGRAALLLQDTDSSRWTGALEHLLDDEEDRIRLGDAARRHVLSHFTWRETARQLERILFAARDKSPVVLQEEEPAVP